jgi:hypothetical protein
MLVRTVHVVLLAGPTSSIAETHIPQTYRSHRINEHDSGESDQLHRKYTKIIEVRGIRSSEMWSRVAWLVVQDVSKERNDIIFKEIILGIVYP